MHVDHTVTFLIGLHPQANEDLEEYSIDGEATYEVLSDDPAYDPRSGNSLTASRRPTTAVDLLSVYFPLKELLSELDSDLYTFGLEDSVITLAFSYEGEDPFTKTENGSFKDNRLLIEVDMSQVKDPDYLQQKVDAINASLYNVLEPFTEDIATE